MMYPYSESTERLAVVAVVALAVVMSGQHVQAQPVPIPSINVDMHVDSGEVSNNLRGGADAAVVFSRIVNVDGAPWLRLRFGKVQLSGSPPNGTGSFLRITSLEDGGVQYLDAVSVAQWRYTSAYFNGDKVRVELLAYPNTGLNRVTLEQVTAGLRAGGVEASQCGPTDDRVPVQSPAHGRVLPVGCSAFIIDDCEHCLLTAGHCPTNPPHPNGTYNPARMDCVEFNVPLSDPDGTINHPLPQYQFAIDDSSVENQFVDGGIGNDWCYFGAFPNSNTGLTPYQEQGLSMILATSVPPSDGDLLVITGYGIDDDPPGSTDRYNQWSQTLQTDNGTYDDIDGAAIHYDDLDTRGASSGSAVVKVGDGLVIGIHTHGGCNGERAANHATRIDNPGLQAALANPQGVCAGGTQEGDHLSIESKIWDDPGGDGDGIPEPGESGITLEVCLNSTSDVALVEATLFSFTGEPDILDPLVDYGTICAGCTDCADDVFDMDLPFPDSTCVGFTLHVNYLLVDGPALFQEFNFIKCFGGVEPEFEICSIIFDDVTEGCSNGDYMLQSGEHADIRIQIRNIGEVTATNVDVCLEPIEGFDCFDSHCISYPDLPPGGPCEEPTFPNNHWDICIPRDVEGTFYTDIIILYGSPPVEVTLPAALVLNIEPAAWLEVKTPPPSSSNTYDFGVAGTNELIEIPILIEDAGNAVMTVTDIITSHPDTTWSGSTLPFDVDPGEQIPITVLIDTSQTPLGHIDRSVCVVSDAHVCDPGQDDCLYITGFVGDAEAVHFIPTVGFGQVDVSGNVIVYSDNRTGDFNIFAFNLEANQEVQVTYDVGDQTKPRISGTLIAWNDHRNGQVDIFGYDLATDCEFVISDDPAVEDLFGVDGDFVAFRRQSTNLYVYRYEPSGCPPSGNTCVLSSSLVDFTGDFGGGTLVWQEATGSRMVQITGNDPCSEPVVELECLRSADPNSADSGRVVYVEFFSDPLEDQISQWHKGDCNQVTQDMRVEHDIPTTGGNLIVFRHGVPGTHPLFYVDLSNPMEELLVTTASNNGPRRMDGNVVAWLRGGEGVYYSFLKEADISVTSAGITLPDEPPYAGEPFDVTVLVNNLAPWGTSDDITVELYDGHPQAGGILLASQVIFGGMDGLGQQIVEFMDIVIDTPGTDPPHDICVRVVVPSGDNPANNIACKPLAILAPGACCYPDDTCDEGVTPDECGGIYQGDGSTCPPDPPGCPVTVGACCLADDTCVDGLTQAACMAAAGTYQGDGSDCARVDCDPCPWDLDDNDTVGASDLLALLVSWGPCKGCPADFDDNGSVGATDLLALLVNWGPCP